MKVNCSKLACNIAKRIEAAITKHKTCRRNKRITSKRRRIATSFRMENPGARRKSILAMTALFAMSAKADTQYHNKCLFDTDSKPIGVDNRCSACISHDITDFIGPLKDSGRTIKGFGGVKHTSDIMVGTLKWQWEDDQGQIHKHIIPNSYYVPSGQARLLSPQHWAKAQRSSRRNSTGETTNSSTCTLKWGEQGE